MYNDNQFSNKIDDLRSQIDGFKTEKSRLDQQIADAEKSLRFALAESNVGKFVSVILSRDKVVEFFSKMDTDESISMFADGFELNLESIFKNIDFSELSTTDDSFDREDGYFDDLLENDDSDSGDEDGDSGVEDGDSGVVLHVNMDDDDDGYGDDVVKPSVAYQTSGDIDKQYRATPVATARDSSVNDGSVGRRFGKSGDFSKALNSIHTVKGSSGVSQDAGRLNLPSNFSSFGRK